MRPQQNRRMRGRGNNNNNNNGNNQNRKGPNPLTRSYESNGPDVKIRGSAQQIAEKYTTLARDAQSAGDRVMAENYLQHAEHYFRIVSSAQQAMNGQRDGQSQDDNEFDDDVSEMNSRFSSPQPVQVHNGHEANEEQPGIAPVAAEGSEPVAAEGGEAAAQPAAAEGGE